MRHKLETVQTFVLLIAAHFHLLLFQWRSLSNDHRQLKTQRPLNSKWTAVITHSLIITARTNVHSGDKINFVILVCVADEVTSHWRSLDVLPWQLHGEKTSGLSHVTRSRMSCLLKWCLLIFTETMYLILQKSVNEIFWITSFFNHIHSWQVSLQLSCVNTYWIWSWYLPVKQCLITVKAIVLDCQFTSRRWHFSPSADGYGETDTVFAKIRQWLHLRRRLFPVSFITQAGLILGLRPANERRRYFVTTSHIVWVQT